MFVTYTERTAAQMLGFDRHQMKNLRESGLLRGIKTGQSWRYREKDLNEFWETYNGSDLSNAEQIKYTATLHCIKKGD